MPFDPRKPFDPSGIRIGTPAVTTRGLGRGHMAPVAGWIAEPITAADTGDDAAIDAIADEVRSMLSSFPMPGYTPTP